ncbi:MAG: membrane protein insertase YidC [Pseudomonadota bacterium]
MEKEDQRNFLIAMVLMIGFIWAYQTFIVDPEVRANQAAREAAAALEAENGPAEAQLPEALAPAIEATVEDALEKYARATFDAPSVDGSIRIRGARIDDLNLKGHYLTVENEAELRLLRPESSEHGYYASYYWLDETGRAVTGLNADWQAAPNAELAVGQPLLLTLEADGLRFERAISLDENYMFTFEDKVTNIGDAGRTLRPYGSVRRHGEWKGFLEATDPGSARDSAIVHQGLIGVIDGNLTLRKYKGLSEGKGIKGDEADKLTDQGGWIGFTDKYWMGALVPEQAREFKADFVRRARDTGQVLEIKTEGAEYEIAPGETITATNQIFAGAKELDVLKEYESGLGIPRFDDAVDWGFLYFLTKPFFTVLLWLNGQLGSFGWAILAFTILVKIPLIPLYNTSFKAMAKMKKLAEPMKEIRERFAADPKRQQQEIMKLYQKEKANPVAGCLPILATIPIFYALYKTLFVTLEMRHEPFFYLKDLSAPDPTAIGNLFGLIPFYSGADVKSIPILGLIIGIGVLPLLYGVTMATLQSLNPPPPDPMQRRIIMLLPIVFTFVFAGFASGLVLYWVWNNVLTLFQQYYIMRRNGAETEIGKFIAARLGRKKDPESS